MQWVLHAKLSAWCLHIVGDLLVVVTMTLIIPFIHMG